MINPKTGKGWSDAEENTFTEIQRVSRLNRIQAIQLFRRHKSDGAKALAVARREYPPLSDARLAAIRKATAASLLTR
jgi:hypothetical protein